MPNDVLDDPELSALFVETALEALDELTQGLLALEKSPDDADLINSLFRAAHNIKGAAGAAGLMVMSRLTHVMETVLDAMRGGSIRLDDELTNALFEAIDALRGVEEIRRTGSFDDRPLEALLVRFHHWLETKVDPGASSLTAAADPGAAAVGGGTADSVAIRIRFAEGFEDAVIQGLLLLGKFRSIGKVVAVDPNVESMPADVELTELLLTVETPEDPESIREIALAYAVEHVDAVRLGSPTGDQRDEISIADPPNSRVDSPSLDEPAQPRPTNAPDQANAAAEATPAVETRTPVKSNATLRVDQSRLDHLMNLGGELVISKARLTQLHRDLRAAFDGRNLRQVLDEMTEDLEQLQSRVAVVAARREHHHEIVELSRSLTKVRHTHDSVCAVVQPLIDARSTIQSLDEAVHGLNRVSEGLQQGIMSTRMVSIGPLFNRYHRVARDIAKSSGKEFRLIIRGETTELDKRMIDELGDPLTHMIRNSMDHGLELPDERRAAGKDPIGTVILDAYHRGNCIWVEVRDDGRGIDVDRVREKIIEGGFVSSGKIETMTDREIVQYVFQPGLTTARELTDLSGRGVGLDIVKSTIDRLNGSIDVETAPGKGTRITIKLPLTLAILTSLIVEIGRNIYAIPLEDVAEIITVRRDRLHHVGRQKVVQIREKIVRIVLFEDIFQCNLPSLQTAAKDKDEFNIVVVGGDDTGRLGLVVDDLLGQEDVVIKSIAGNYRNVSGIAGATIRGDGTVSLILDVRSMFHKIDQTESSEPSLAPCAELQGTC